MMLPTAKLVKKTTTTALTTTAKHCTSNYFNIAGVDVDADAVVATFDV